MALQYYAPLAVNMIGSNLANETHVRASTATYIDGADGLLKEAAVDIPRFELVGGHNALLVEPAGTNVCLRSREFDHASWVQAGSTNPTANETGIDGEANLAYTLTDNSAVALEHSAQTIVIPNDSNTHVAYVYIKKDEDETRFPEITLYIDNGGTPVLHRQHLNTKTGASVQAEGAGSYGVIDRGDWWQLWMTIANNSSGNLRLRLYILPAAATVIGTRTATAQGSCIFDAAQVELDKNIPSSVIHTVASSVTRATDSGYPRWDLPADLFDAEGTAIIWFRPGFAEAAASADGGILACSDLSFLLLYTDISGNGVASSDGTTQATQALAYAAYTWYKLIVKWGYDDGGEKFRVGIDSGSGVSWGTEQNFDGSHALGSYLRIGHTLFGPMHLAGLRLYDNALSDAEIDAVVSPSVASNPLFFGSNF